MALSVVELQALSVDERREYYVAKKRLARLAAHDSLAAYGGLVFGLDPAAHHRLLIEGLEAIERGEISGLNVIMPPGHAKSTYASIIFPSWYLSRHPEHSLTAVTLSDTLAGLYDGAFATVFEQNAEQALTFPTVRPRKTRGWSSAGRFLTGQPQGQIVAARKDPQIVYAGAGRGIVGRRAHGIILDDVIDLAIARSPEVQMPARLEWIRSSLFTRLSPGGWRVSVGTLWAEDDAVDSFRKSGEWVTIVVPAESDGARVWATVEIPNDVSWRPAGWQEGANR